MIYVSSFNQRLSLLISIEWSTVCLESLKPRAGQFLSVNGRDFTYGGEKVSSLFHELGNYFLVFATKSLLCLRTLMEKLDIFLH